MLHPAGDPGVVHGQLGSRWVDQYVIRLKTSPGSSLARPPRNESSIRNAQATTSAPVDVDQVAAGPHRAAGGQDIVDQEDALPGPEGVGVDFELVACRTPVDIPARSWRKGACPACGSARSRASISRASGAPKMKPRASAAAITLIPLPGEMVVKLGDRLAERRGMAQERRDVLEHDARLGEIGDVADVVAEVERRWAAEHESSAPEVA